MEKITTPLTKAQIKQNPILADAIGNVYRAAFFLARSPRGKKLASQMLEKAIDVLQKFNRKESAVLARLHQQIGKIKTKRERLILAEYILDEYKTLAHHI